MAALTLTAVNSIYMLTVPSLFPVPQQLTQFSADAAFDTEAAEVAENMMGVDGVMSSGFIPFMTKQTISLMANSPSGFLFDEWMRAQAIVREVYPANATISLPAIGRKYTLTNGVLTSYPAMPDVKKIMGPRAFVITWNSISPAAF